MAVDEIHQLTWFWKNHLILEKTTHLILFFFRQTTHCPPKRPAPYHVVFTFYLIVFGKRFIFLKHFCFPCFNVFSSVFVLRVFPFLFFLSLPVFLCFPLLLFNTVRPSRRPSWAIGGREARRAARRRGAKGGGGCVFLVFFKVRKRAKLAGSRPSPGGTSLTISTS